MTSRELSEKIANRFRDMGPAIRDVRCDQLVEMFIEGVANKKSCTEIACDFLEKHCGEREEIYVS